MKRLMRTLTALALTTAVVGCSRGDQKVRPEGHLLKADKEFIPGEGEFIQITFVPVVPAGKTVTDFYYAEVDQDSGMFSPAGADRKGMPPGKYRVAIELMKKKKDLWGGRFDADNSPFVFDVDSSTKEIVIDIDRPPMRAAT